MLVALVATDPVLGLSAYSKALVAAHRDWFAAVVADALRHADPLQDGHPQPWRVARRTWQPPIVAMYAARFDSTLVESDDGGWRREEVADDLAVFEPDAPRAGVSSDWSSPVLLREDVGGLYAERDDGRVVRDPREISDLIERCPPAVSSLPERAVAEAIASFQATHPGLDVNWIIPAGMQPAFAAAGILRERKPAGKTRWRPPAPHNLARACVARGLAADHVAGGRAIARWLVDWERAADAPWSSSVADAIAEQAMLRAVARSAPWVEDHVIGGIVPRRYQPRASDARPGNTSPVASGDAPTTIRR